MLKSREEFTLLILQSIQVLPGLKGAITGILNLGQVEVKGNLDLKLPPVSYQLVQSRFGMILRILQS